MAQLVHPTTKGCGNSCRKRNQAALVLLTLAGLLLAAASGWQAPRASAEDEAAAQPPRFEITAPLAQDYGIEQVAQINKYIRQGWRDYELQPSPQATDGEWCRRVHLDLIGRIPTHAEVTAFLADDSPDKRAKLVGKLLYDDKYTEEYARNWTTLWTNILIGRNGGMEDNSLTNRAGLQKYLRDSFARNKPYDRMAYELITATGHNSPGAENFNGAVNFLTSKLEDNGILATAATSKVFLGLAVQCTQCHNHPLNQWKQRKFWEMNAFFRQTAALRRFAPGTRDVTGAELVNQDFEGESGDPEEADLFYELRSGLLKVAYPVFVTGQEIGKSGYLSDVDRRTQLGKLIMKSEYLERAMVNRTWKHFLGYGFTKPIDDMGPHNPPSHPGLMDYLAAEFRKNSFDLKELIRWIVLSEPYALSSRMTDENKSDDPLLGEPPKFSHFYLRQMRAEELYESLITATQAHKTRGSYAEQEKAKAEWLDQFVVAFGTDEGDETTTFNGTIPQVLMMFNGALIKQATSTQKGGFLDRIASDPKLSSKEKIEYLYLAALARKPNGREIDYANKLLYARKGDTAEALKDVWWVLLNSNEFILNH